MTDRVEEKKINEALDLLNDLARARKADMRDIVSDKYINLRAVLDSVIESSQRRARIAHAQGTAQARDSASRVERTLHGRPRPHIGRTALVFLTLGYVFTLGYFVARSRKR